MALTVKNLRNALISRREVFDLQLAFSKCAYTTECFHEAFIIVRRINV